MADDIALDILKNQLSNLDILRKKLNRAINGILIYADHSLGCAYFDDEVGCDCGLKELLEEFNIEIRRKPDETISIRDPLASDTYTADSAKTTYIDRDIEDNALGK